MSDWGVVRVAGWLELIDLILRKFLSDDLWVKEMPWQIQAFLDQRYNSRLEELKICRNVSGDGTKSIIFQVIVCVAGVGRLEGARSREGRKNQRENGDEGGTLSSLTLFLRWCVSVTIFYVCGVWRESQEFWIWYHPRRVKRACLSSRDSNHSVAMKDAAVLFCSVPVSTNIIITMTTTS
jgi:hypothetical protein